MDISAQVLGKIITDAELIKENGKMVVKFTIHCPKIYKNKNGVEYEIKRDVACTYIGNENTVFYLKKGVTVLANGTPGANGFLDKVTGEISANLTLKVKDFQVI